MEISVEISLYPLEEKFNKPIELFVEQMEQTKDILFETGKMSSYLSGEYKTVMQAMTKAMENILELSPSAFVIKLSNACPI